MALSLRAHHIFAAHSATLLGFTYLVALVTAMFLAIVLILAVYNLYFHPLRNFPGPKPWIAFPILYHVSSIRGLLDIDLCRYHTTYGEVVRFLPNEISFTTAQAWNDIYGHGHRQMPKPFRRTHGEPHNILISNDADHARFRKALSNAFSERALREQEPLLTVYVDLLIEKLRDISAAGSKTDMVRWYNFTTFDLIGDLSFGEPFNCLQESQMHYWVANVFHFLKTLPLVRVSLEYPLFFKFLCLFMPANVNNAQSEQWRLVREKVRKRINNTAQTDRKDFMDSMLKHNGDKDELSLDELVSNAHILIIAGSETTATLLSGVTYWLHRTPEVLEKVTKEIRDAFKDESENNFITASARLPYMLACLKEALRIYPPVPTILPRATLPGAPTMISGYEVPENTHVGVHQLSAYSSPRNFHLPDRFIPERWLPSSQSFSSPFASDNRAVLQPFHVGPRNCIGQNLAYNEMRLILTRVLWNFDLELCGESMGWNEQRSYQLREKGPPMCKLKERKR